MNHLPADPGGILITYKGFCHRKVPGGVSPEKKANARKEVHKKKVRKKRASRETKGILRISVPRGGYLSVTQWGAKLNLRDQRTLP